MWIKFIIIIIYYYFLTFNKHFVGAVCVPHMHVNTLNYALIFYPAMNIDNKKSKKSIGVGGGGGGGGV